MPLNPYGEYWGCYLKRREGVLAAEWGVSKASYPSRAPDAPNVGASCATLVQPFAGAADSKWVVSHQSSYMGWTFKCGHRSVSTRFRDNLHAIFACSSRNAVFVRIALFWHLSGFVTLRQSLHQLDESSQWWAHDRRQLATRAKCLAARPPLLCTTPMAAMAGATR